MKILKKINDVIFFVFWSPILIWMWLDSDWHRFYDDMDQIDKLVQQRQALKTRT